MFPNLFNQSSSMLQPSLTTLSLPDLRPQTFRRRDIIPLRPDRLWQIETGVVRTLTWDKEGTIIILGFWGVGNIVGQPLFHVNPYQVECLTSVQASIFSPTNGYPQDSLIWQVRQTEELLRIIHTKRMESRLEQLLSWLAYRFGRQIVQGQLIDLRLTHQEIADVLGTTRVTVTRLLNQLKKREVIEWSHQHCVLLSKLEHH